LAVEEGKEAKLPVGSRGVRAHRHFGAADNGAIIRRGPTGTCHAISPYLSNRDSSFFTFFLLAAKRKSTI
jgi:hypothetical protein